MEKNITDAIAVGTTYSEVKFKAELAERSIASTLHACNGYLITKEQRNKLNEAMRVLAEIKDAASLSNAINYVENNIQKALK